MIKPYYEADGITLYHGDCREILPGLTADAVVTDPPYGIGFDYGDGGHNDDPGSYGAFVWSVIRTAEILLPPDGYSVVFQSATTAHMWPQWFPRDWRIFTAPKSFAQIRPCRPFQAVDFALYWRKDGGRQGKQPWHPKPGRDWFVSSETAATANRPDHPCPRPIDLMLYLVALFVPPGRVVLDPFNGSGTTLLAAKQLGRRAIGIEVDERHCETTARRLSQRVLDFGGAA